jgi:serine/threonine protein kinase
LALRMAVPSGICVPTACGHGYYEYVNHDEVGSSKVCKPANSRLCVPCSASCPEESYESSPCNATADRACKYDCSRCVSDECMSFCLSQKRTKSKKLMAFQTRIFVAEIVFAIILVLSVTGIACLYVRHKLQHCQCSKSELRLAKSTAYSFRKDNIKIQPDVDDLKIKRAQEFTYEELEQATGGFSEDSQVGKGSFSCVFKGILRDGTVVAVKRAIKATDVKKSSKEFHNELDLLSRLNHAHLLNLLGYCEDGSERLLVYEFMAHGSLYQHLHGKDPNLKKRLNWARRVTIAVQAARGIEYLHGYACPPVIHRDIKSSNILIDEDHNARVADFGLSILGPADSGTPLSELPAGTLGYLDPEYYRLHYLTTKSDVYSFGVVLLEILSGRKAIDMQFEEGNIVEWAVPLVKAGDIFAILDPVLSPPSDVEALKKIASVACKCVRMRGKDRPSMDRVTTALEHALALLMGSPYVEQPILPTEVILGSSRMHKVSQMSSNHSCSENELADREDQRIEYRAPSWITFPSVTSSQRRKSSASEADIAGRTTTDGRNVGSSIGDGLRSLEEEIGPASPPENLYLQHNF